MACLADLPPNYDVDVAHECLHWACGLAYQTPVGREVKPFIVHPSGIALVHVRGDELLVVFRGTVLKMFDEVKQNVSGCGMNPTEIFEVGRTSCLPGEARTHQMYLSRAMDVLFNWLNIEVFDPESGFKWSQFKNITVTGHSMGGSVAELFAYLLAETQRRLRGLQEGYLTCMHTLHIDT